MCLVDVSIVDEPLNGIEFAWSWTGTVALVGLLEVGIELRRISGMIQIESRWNRR